MTLLIAHELQLCETEVQHKANGVQVLRCNEFCLRRRLQLRSSFANGHQMQALLEAANF